MKKQIVILILTAFAALAYGQAHLEGDSIVVDAPVDTNSLDFTIQIQNLDNLAESVYFWEAQGAFKIPWCNVRVSRTSYDSMLVATSEWSIDLKIQPVEIGVHQLPGRRLVISTNLPVLAQVRHIAHGGPYAMMLGSQQVWPTASLQPGQYEFFVPYRIAGWQVVTAKVGGTCPHTSGRLVFMN